MTGPAAFLLKLTAAAVLIGLAFLLWLASAGTARAHEAIPTAAQPRGWTYPFACCSGYDCREVKQGDGLLVDEEADGYHVGTASPREVLGFSDAKVKPSPDGEYHWCSVAGKDDGRTICLFVPPKSF